MQMMLLLRIGMTSYLMMLWTWPCYCLDMLEVVNVDSIPHLGAQNLHQSLKEDAHLSWVDIVDNNASVE